jgi:hypothetical protein
MTRRWLETALKLLIAAADLGNHRMALCDQSSTADTDRTLNAAKLVAERRSLASILPRAALALLAHLKPNEPRQRRQANQGIRSVAV